MLQIPSGLCQHNSFLALEWDRYILTHRVGLSVGRLVQLRLGALSARRIEPLEDWSLCSRGAVSEQSGRYSSSTPIVPYCDLNNLVDSDDVVAETIHREVTIPWQKEREEISFVLLEVTPDYAVH